MEWSQCGRYLASVCKDGKIRIFEPRKSTLPISEGGEIVPKKGARIAWVLDGQYLIVTGFSKYVYKLIYLPHGRSKMTVYAIRNEFVIFVLKKMALGNNFVSKKIYFCQ